MQWIQQKGLDSLNLKKGLQFDTLKILEIQIFKLKDNLKKITHHNFRIKVNISTISNNSSINKFLEIITMVKINKWIWLLKLVLIHSIKKWTTDKMNKIYSNNSNNQFQFNKIKSNKLPKMFNNNKIRIKINRIFFSFWVWHN
jgi:hypothetical protein